MWDLKHTWRNTFTYYKFSFSCQMWDLKQSLKDAGAVLAIGFSCQMWDLKTSISTVAELNDSVLAAKCGI